MVHGRLVIGAGDNGYYSGMAVTVGDAVGEASFWIVVSCMVVLGLSTVGFLLGKWARARMLKDDSSSPTGFGLGDLRRLLQQGKITQAEFDRAKGRIIEAEEKRAAAIPPPGQNPSRQNPS